MVDVILRCNLNRDKSPFQNQIDIHLNGNVAPLHLDQRDILYKQVILVNSMDIQYCRK